MQNYERLDAFKCLKELVKHIYQLTIDLPKDEKWGLQSQMKRSSISSLSNLVEGVSRRSNKEKLRFIEISYSSLLELDVQIILCQELMLITNSETIIVRKHIVRSIEILSGLRRSFLSQLPPR